MVKILKKQAGQATNYSSIANAVKVSSNTVSRWINVLQSLYFCFTIKPWSKNVKRSLIKEPKVYLWDWSEVQDPGARYENFIACHLLKATHFWTDYGLGEFELHFLRDKEKRAVDFLVTRDGKPWFLVEAKLSNNQRISPALHYFQEQTQSPHAFQVVYNLPFHEKNCFDYKKPIIVSAQAFLSQLV